MTEDPDIMHVRTQDEEGTDYVQGFTVFNIGGNKYRLITRIDYERKRVYIREVLTHAEYSRRRWKRR